MGARVRVPPATPSFFFFFLSAAPMDKSQNRYSKFLDSYTRSNYRIVGNHKHSALKPCHWMIQKLLSGGRRNCYKGYFGIESEKCIQCTPSLPYCTHNCVFCWRDLEHGNMGATFKIEPDEPEELIKGFIKHQRNIVTHHIKLQNALDNYEIMRKMLSILLHEKDGANMSMFQKQISYSKNKLGQALLMLKNLKLARTVDLITYYISDELSGSQLDPELILKERVTTPEKIKKTFQDALEPSHAAISLAGEPTLYPGISELIAGFRKHKFSTFIVSNGTTPEVLESMDSLPTQLYITLPPPDEQLYKKIHRPSIRGTYDRIQKSLNLLPSLSCRKILRITHVKTLNDHLSGIPLKAWVKMIDTANPDFLDIKGFAVEARALLLKKRMGLGGDGRNIGESASFAPEFDDVLEFATLLSEEGNYPIIETVEASRDVLLRVNWPEQKSIKITNL